MNKRIFRMKKISENCSCFVESLCVNGNSKEFLESVFKDGTCDQWEAVESEKRSAKVRARVKIILDVGDPLPEIGKYYGCESYPNAEEKYRVKVQKIAGMSWMGDKLVVEVIGKKFDCDEIFAE